jgi:osmoprotectant transport system permease protein
LLWETLTHLLVILYSMPVAILLGVSTGFFISTRPRFASAVTTISSIIMTIPSLALFGIMVVLLAPIRLGLGIAPAVIAIILYSLLPIIRNTATALNTVSPNIIEAARGMGFTRTQILFRIKVPLSIPVILAGIRNALVLGVGIATFAFLVAAGGLGYFIFSGISRSNILMVLSGAVLVSLLGMGLNYLFLRIESLLTPRGLKYEKERGNLL